MSDLIIITLILIIFDLLIFMWGYIINIISYFTKQKSKKIVIEKHFSFTSIIPAHNEEKTISRTLKSLQKQTYKNNDIYVILDNCTDNTKNEIKTYKNINIIEKKEKSTNKGDAIKYGIDYLKKIDKLHDIIVIFDADATIDENLIFKLNEKYKTGSNVVMTNSDVLNPYDNIITNWYAIYWKMISIFSRKPHSILNLSSNISGCGMSFKKEYLVSTKTVTEDIEYFMILNMNDIKVDYLDETSTYQEQPTTFKDMIHQLYRWSSGVVKTNKLYLRKYLKSLLKKFNLIKLDALITSQTCSFLGLLIFLLIILIILVIFNNKFILYLLILLIIIALFVTLIAFNTVVKSKYKLKKMYKGILTYFIFIILLGLIYNYSLIFASEKWIKIKRREE